MYITIDDQPVVDSSVLYEARSQSYVPAYWWNKVNSIELYRGRRSNEAHILVESSVKDLLAMGSAHTIKIYELTGDPSAPMPSLVATMGNWWIYQCEAAVGINDGNKLFYIQLRDPRQIGELKDIGVTPAEILKTHRNIADVTDVLSPVTWQTVLNELWNLLPSEAKAGSSVAPTLPITPSSTADNLTFESMSAWRAICQSLQACGMVPVFDQLSGIYRIFDYDSTQSGLSAAITANQDRLLWEGSIPSIAPLKTPEKIGVVFPSSKETPSQKVFWYSTPKITELTTSTPGTISGTVINIVDTTRVEYGIADLESNFIQLDNRALDLKRLIRGKLKSAFAERVTSFSGYVNITPGSEITQVVIRVKLNKPSTTIYKHEPLEFDTPNSTPDLPSLQGKAFHVQTPSAGIPARSGSGPWTPGFATCLLCEWYSDDGATRKIRVKSPPVSLRVYNDQPSTVAGSTLIECKLVNGVPCADVAECA